MNTPKLLSLPTNWWQQEFSCQRLRDCFQRHIVGLHLRIRLGKEVSHEFFTGFLIHFRHRFMWATAGHVVQRIDAILRDSRLESLKSSLVDHAPNSQNMSIPVDVADLPRMAIDADGFDFGAIALRPNLVALLLNNPNVQFLDERIWHGFDQAKPDGYFVVGYPYCWNRFLEAKGGKGLVTTAVACLPAIQLDDKGEEANEGLDRFWGHSNCFYAQLIPFSDTKTELVQDIGGMSGGPIFSIERNSDGNAIYRLYGIQSSWLGDSRIVRGIHVREIAELFETMRKRRCRVKSKT